MEDPDMRVWINPEVCEGCGDCSLQSNCVAVEPLETGMGRKRAIDQSACNKDFSCLKGFCPSFVTVRGGRLRRGARATAPDVSELPTPALPGLEKAWNIAVTGVGGTGVLTIGALVAMAAALEGKNPMLLDMAGLAQKGGAVMSHIRIGRAGAPVTSPRIACGAADLLLAADSVVAASREAATICDPARTSAVVNARAMPVSDFTRARDFDFRAERVARTVRASVREGAHFHDFGGLARALTGEAIGANILMLGYAWQMGLVPLAAASIEAAIGMNGVAIGANTDAFRWGRLLAHDPARVTALAAAPTRPALADLSTEAIVAARVTHLTAYQDARLAARYRARVSSFTEAARARLADPEACDALERAVAVNYARVLAYKDEYEVARLYAAPAFREGIAEAFEGDVRLSFNLAPPFMPGRDANGRPRKRAFGAYMMPVFRGLARLRGLRGTMLDPFGRSAERRAERAMIVDYEADVARVAAVLAPETEALCRELLELPGMVRGFGPVKAEALRAASSRRAGILAALDAGPAVGPFAHAAE